MPVSRRPSLLIGGLTRSRKPSRRVQGPDRRFSATVAVLEGRALLTAATVTTLELSAATIRFSQTETLTADVTSTGGTPDAGSVTFNDGSTTLGVQPVVNGAATLSIATLAPGQHFLQAIYSGDGATFGGSSSPTPHGSVISTVAGGGSGGDGGLATAAELDSPYGIAVDAEGNLYIAESGSSDVVRRVDRATGIITTVAGTGPSGSTGIGGPATSARLVDPRGVAVDAAGNLYIADAAGARVLRVDHATGILTDVAGNGTSSGGGIGDGGPATSASLQYPTGVAVDAAGNLYIADSDRIRKVDAATGIINTIAGGGYAGPGTALGAEIYPYKVSVDSSGNLYTANGAEAFKIDQSTGLISIVAGSGYYGYGGDGGPATQAALSEPESVAVDPSGNLDIADTENYRIRQVGASTGFISTIAGTGAYGFSGDGGPSVNAELSLPLDVAVDSSGNIYVADFGNGRIREITPSVSTVSVIPTASSSGAGDYNGDGKADLALFNATTATWQIRNPDGTSQSVQFGSPGDTAAPGDYEGIGKSDLATYTPSTATWNIQESTGVVHIQFGDPAFGDVAAPADYDGDGKTDLAVFRPSTDEWIIRPSSGGPDEILHYGDPAQGDTPVPGDYFGTGMATLAVFRPSSDLWIIRQPDGTDRQVNFGDPSTHDVPAEGDYTNLGHTDLAVYDPTTSYWTFANLNAIQVTSPIQFGSTSTATTDVPALSPIVNIPVVQGIAPDELASFRPLADEWLIRQSNGALRTAYFPTTVNSDLVAVPGDYEGTGRQNLAVFDPTTDTWSIQLFDGTVKKFQFGDPAQGDIAAPADYDGDGKTDFAVFRPSTDQWIIHPSSGGPNEIFQYGDPAQGDIPVPGNYFGTGKAALAVFRPSVDLWILLKPDGTNDYLQFGDPSANDTPAPGAYNGDGMTDLALYRPEAGLWIILTDISGTTSLISFGDPSKFDKAARSPTLGS